MEVTERPAEPRFVKRGAGSVEEKLTTIISDLAEATAVIQQRGEGTPETADAFVLLEAAVDQLRSAGPFPRLVVVEVEDPDDAEEVVERLKCPSCEEILGSEEEISAIDMATRSTTAREIDFDSKYVQFYFDNEPDWGSTLYYEHNNDHRVLLPEGWDEES